MIRSGGSNTEEDSLSLYFRNSTLMSLFYSQNLLIIFYDIKLFIFKVLAIYTVLLWCLKAFNFIVGSERALAYVDRRAMRWHTTSRSGVLDKRRATCIIRCMPLNDCERTTRL